MDFTEAFDLFKSNYNSHDYAMTERDYPAECVYVGAKRHGVVDVFRANDKYGKTYFIVYKKSPIKELKKKGDFEDNTQCGYFHCEVNRMQR
ncbi:MAG: hypothetical protein ACYDDE_03975 [bacterium]